MMTTATASSVRSTGFLRLPNYELLPTALLKGLEDAAVAVMESNSVPGDLFNMALVAKLPLTDVAADAVVLIPLFTTTDAAAMDSTTLAVGPIMYVRLDGPPQPRAIFGTCIAYSEGAVPNEIQLGTKVQFPPPSHLLVAKPALLDLFDEDSGTTAENPNGRPTKRSRVRLPEEGGEQTEGKHDVEKGTTKYILDLDGNKHITRNKSDIMQREKDLGFVFRTVDEERWEHVMGSDFLLQVDYYKTTITQQARLRANRRHEAFISCGFIDRIQDLNFIQTSDRLKLLITGQIMVEGDSATLCLEDFADGEMLSNSEDVCPNQNRPMVVVLKNIQTAFQVFLSKAFEGVFDDFIIDLEGAERPLELVASDFLHYSVEECIRKFSRTVSTERSYLGIPMPKVSNPTECAFYLSGLFDQLSEDLSDHQSRKVEEEYFRAHLLRQQRAAAKFHSTPTPSKRSADKTPTKTRDAIDATRETTKRTCAGHFGKQLKATFSDGRAYKCAFGKTCKFLHVGKVGKTHKQVLDIISALPTTARDDLTRAVQKTA